MGVAEDLAALQARLDVLEYEAAQRRGLTVAEYRAWWADPVNRRRLDEPVVVALPPASRPPRRRPAEPREGV